MTYRFTPEPRLTREDAVSLAGDLDTLVRNLATVVRGKDDVLRRVTSCLVAEGHLLIEDYPGTGKTTIARALAASVDLAWRRIQFTPDVLPSDVTGSEVFNQGTRAFEFRPGPVFANIVLADEINRASPKTQSALLEVMEERRVTVGGVPYPAPRPFLVVATQNPVEMDGTYRLPEAQLDRFLMRIGVGYPDQAAEVEILGGAHDGAAVDNLSPVLGPDRLQALIAAASAVRVDEAVKHYIVELTATTRSLPDVALGVSPRGSVALLRTARAAALADGRNYVRPEDVKALAVPVLAHRVVLTPKAAMQGRTADDVLAEVAGAVPVPHVNAA